jgi:hypothetical protein
MRHITTTAILCLAFTAVTTAKEKAEDKAVPLPTAKDVKSISIAYYHPKRRRIEFKATPADWKVVRGTLLPARHDPKPAKWKAVGRVKIVKKDGKPFQVELYRPSKGPGAFAAGKTFKERVYYRGGNSSKLMEALHDAYEKSKARDK